MDKITYICCLFQPRPGMPEWCNVYTPEWVDKLYRGIERNTSGDFDFVCLVDKEYEFEEMVFQEKLWKPNEGFGSLCEAWRPDLGIHRRCVLGLDTVIVGNIDSIMQTELPTGVGLLRDPYAVNSVGNMVGLYDERACAGLWDGWCGKTSKINDQNFLRKFVGVERCTLLNDRFPGQILSYKVDLEKGRAHIRDFPDLKIVYFHGNPKPNELDELNVIREFWI